MWNQIMRHGGKLYFEELRSIESESVTNKANDNSIVIARRILETSNVFPGTLHLVNMMQKTH